MTVTNANLDFTSDDNSNWSNFLNTQTGQRLLPKLAEAAPLLLPGGNTNDILVRSGELRGFQEAIRVLLSLTEVPQAPPQPIDAYPDLDDPTKWLDNKPI